MEITRGVAVRLAAALMAAIICGWWLRRTTVAQASPPASTVGQASPSAISLPACLLLALCAFWSAAWLVIALIRLPYPFELEWLGGQVRDYTERVLAGRPIYTTPTSDWIPFEYTPVYFYVSAALQRIFGLSGFASLRLVSILSTLGCATLLYKWVLATSLSSRAKSRDRSLNDTGLKTSADPSTSLGMTSDNPHSQLPTPKYWGFVAAGLLLAAYRMTGAWYDVERVDMLALFLSLLGAAALNSQLSTLNSAKIVLSALAFTAAFLTKQQSILFVIGAVAALSWQRQWRHAGLLSGTFIAAAGAACLALDASSGGWFRYYCFSIPMAAGIKPHLALSFLLLDLPLYAPSLAIIVLCAFRGRLAPGGPSTPPPPPEHLNTCSSTLKDPTTLLLCLTAAGLLSSLLSRAHWGGDQNVLIPGYTLLTVAACAAAARIASGRPDARLPLVALALAQVLVLTYRPDAQVPTAASRAAGERFAQAVARLEREGEVLVLDHGGFTKPRHCHFFGLMNVTNAEGRLPPAVADAIQSRRFTAIVLDSPPPTSGPLAELSRHYPYAESLELGESWVVTGFKTPGPDRKVWVLRP